MWICSAHDKEKSIMFSVHKIYSTKIFAIALLIFVASCADSAGSTERIPSATSTDNVEVSSSRTPRAPESSPTPLEILSLATPIYTLIPKITNTPRPTNSPTWTPVPTLPRDEAFEALINLYRDNGGCQLPCWWGIHPGKTTWESAHEILAPLGPTWQFIVNETLDVYTFEFDVPKNMDLLEYLESDLWVKDGLIRAISLNTSWIEEDFDYSLSGILNIIGQPEEIWIKVNTDTMDLPLYVLDLFYPSKGILINSTGEARAVDNIAVTICPKEFRRGNFPPAILVWNPSRIYSYKNIGSDLLGESRDIGGEGFHPLGELSIDIDEEEFFNIYQDPMVDKCFDIDVTKLEQ